MCGVEMLMYIDQDVPSPTPPPPPRGRAPWVPVDRVWNLQFPISHFFLNSLVFAVCQAWLAHHEVQEACKLGAVYTSSGKSEGHSGNLSARHRLIGKSAERLQILKVNIAYLCATSPQGPLKLAGCDWMDGMRLPHFLRGCFWDAQEPDLSFLHKLLQSFTCMHLHPVIHMNIGFW